MLTKFERISDKENSSDVCVELALVCEALRSNGSMVKRLSLPVLTRTFPIRIRVDLLAKKIQ